MSKCSSSGDDIGPRKISSGAQEDDFSYMKISCPYQVYFPRIIGHSGRHTEGDAYEPTLQLYMWAKNSYIKI